MQKKVKVSDYIAKRLKEHYGVDCFFMVSGGGAMHLNDSMGQHIPYIANHHEQACAMAAEGYVRVNQKLAVVNVTTGPGGLNCLNGVFGQWTDSVPVLYISGQVKRETMLGTFTSFDDVGPSPAGGEGEIRPDSLRQLGDQEVNIIQTVKHLTKYAVCVTEPNEIKYHLDKAIYEATTGRFGPVWLDIPIDVQASIIDEDELVEYVPSARGERAVQQAGIVIEKLKAAKRPLIIAGHGIRLAKAEKKFFRLLEKLNIPVVTTLNGFDSVEDEHPNYIGRIGTIGQRAGNFALQNADLVLCLGTRNNIRQVSYNWENFAKNAYKIVVDIDRAELDKPTVIPDLKICADLADFLPELIQGLMTPHPTFPLKEGGQDSFSLKGKDYVPPLRGDRNFQFRGGEKEIIRLYSEKSLNYAIELRKNMTDAENLLWYYLRKRQMNGVKFRKQSPIGEYIVDFISFEKKFIIELDGGQHLDEKNIKHDKLRKEFLNKKGFKVLRFFNNDVFENLEGVLQSIYDEVFTWDCPPPQPSPSRGEGEYSEWLNWCVERRKKYAFKPEKTESIDPYQFTFELTKQMKDDDIMTMANASATVCTFQNAIVKKGQRYITNSGDASMGYGLPAAIGACLAKKTAPRHQEGQIICLEGDGSIMMNIQELQTIKHYNLPIKIFILNNKGYVSIRQTQNNFFDGRLTGAGEQSGVSVPDFVEVAEAFKLKAIKISNPQEMEAKICEVLNSPRPVLCEVLLEQNYSFSPKLSSRKLEDGTMVSPALEDMFPFLGREEFNQNMI